MSGKRRGRGEGNIEALPSGKFRAVLSCGRGANGKRRKQSRTFDTKREAASWLRDRLSEQSKGTLADPGRWTVASWLESWLADRKGAVEARTYDGYESHCRLHITPHLGPLPLAQLRPIHVQEMFAAMAKAGASGTLRHHVAATLRAALKRAVAVQLLASNPALAVGKPRMPRRGESVRVWDAGQAARFRAAVAGDRLSALFVLALDSGMRLGELLGLHWPEVDFAGGAVRVVRALSQRRRERTLKEVKTPCSRRRIGLPGCTMAALAAHRERMRSEGRDVDAGPVFLGRAGGLLWREHVRGRCFRPAVKRAGVPAIRVHDLRHTHATLLLLNGVNVKAVSVRLGHSSAQVTLDLYSHWMPEMDGQICGVVERLAATEVKP